MSRHRNSLTTKAVDAPARQGATTKSYVVHTSRRSNAAGRDAAAADWQAVTVTGHLLPARNSRAPAQDTRRPTRSSPMPVSSAAGPKEHRVRQRWRSLAKYSGSADGSTKILCRGRVPASRQVTNRLVSSGSNAGGACGGRTWGYL